MSEMKRHFGKMRLLTKTTEETLDYIRQHNLESEFDIVNRETGELWYIEPKTGKYEILDKNGNEISLVEMIEHTEVPEDQDLWSYTKNSDGTVSFAIEYYNGGTCLTECLSEIFEDLGDLETDLDDLVPY